jgi:ABC-type glycerol-3-phosphate transport system substrate-binding protein
MATRLTRRDFMKISGLAAGAAATSSILAGCAPKETATPIVSQPVELTWWFMQNRDDEIASFQALIDGFTAQNPEVTIKPQAYSWVDVKPLMLSAINAGQPPDIMQTTPDFTVSVHETGALKPVDDIVKMLDEKYKFIPSQVDAHNWGDHIWAIPAFGMCHLLWYNKAMLEAAGFSQAPTTWDELTTQAKAITDAGAGIYACAFGLSNNMFTDQVVWQFMITNGGDLFDADNNLTFNSPENVGALAYLKGLQPLIPPDATGWWWANAIDAFCAEKSAFCYMFGMPGSWHSRNPDKLDRLSGVAPVVSATGEPGTTSYSNGMMVFTDDANKRAAIAKLFDYALEPDNYGRWLGYMQPTLFVPVTETGLDSKTLFEAPIINQYKEEYRLSIEVNKTGKLFGFTRVGKPPAAIGPIAGGSLMAVAVQKMILEDMEPQAAADWGQAEMEKAAQA